MDATFRPRRAMLYQALGLTPLFLAWGGATLWLAATDPEVRSPAGFAALSSIPFFMAGLGGWMMLNHFRSSLTFQGGRVVSRGVWKRSEMDLGGVTEARWGPGRFVRLRAPFSRLTIGLDEFEKADHEAIVAGLRAGIPPEAQRGWDLFVYQTRIGLPEKRTPGPGEVLRTRRDSLRVYLAAVALSVPAVVVAWWATGRASTLLVIPGLTAVALGFGFMTPAEGVVQKSLSWRDDSGVLWFLVGSLAWGVICLGPFVALERAWKDSPPAALFVGAIGVFLAGLLPMAARMDRRSRARDEKAATRAAAERAGSGFPSGGAGL